jgi:hypothetical protein
MYCINTILSNHLSRDIGFFGLLHKIKDWTLFYIVTKEDAQISLYTDFDQNHMVGYLGPMIK